MTIAGLPIVKKEKSETSGKKTYEKIVFACKTDYFKYLLPDQHIIISTPSGIHSHKPPIHGKFIKYNNTHF